MRIGFELARKAYLVHNPHTPRTPATLARLDAICMRDRYQIPVITSEDDVALLLQICEANPDAT